MSTHRQGLPASLAIAFLLAAQTPASGSESQPPLSETQQALHVLNRLAFGPRPGEVERVANIGVNRWIEEQLHPERIKDAAVDSRLAALPTLSMSSNDIVAEYAQPFIEMRRSQRQDAARRESTGENAEEAEPARDRQPTREQRARSRQLVEELTAARILRAVESERQLNEVMTDFWMNHFNVFAGKGLDRFFLTSFERDVVRPRIWGRFEDLLMATAKSPAMLFYLDNARSVAAMENRAQPAGFGRQGRGRRAARANTGDGTVPARNAGINENYARELMELHTLGVDGGYTQTDVTELARVLTGWTIARPEEGGGFTFRPFLHDRKPKVVLGQTFPGDGGIEEGEAMIRFLARHPSTARHLAYKLCQKLVADEPPADLVERVAKRYLATNGNLRETVRAIVTSPEFFDRTFYRAKVKTPFEYVASALRATGARTDGRLVAIQLRELGQPLYFCQPPTGYADTAETWVNSGALLNRLNFATSLTAGRVPGTVVDTDRLVGPEAQSVESWADAVLAGDVSEATLETIEKRLAQEPGEDRRARNQLIAGLMIGSPEFQRQ